MYSPKMPLPVQGSSPHVIHCSSGQALSPLIVPNGMSIGSAVFVWVPNAMLYNELSMGKKPFPVIGDVAYHHQGLSHSHRQHAKKFGKDHMWGSGHILSDRQTVRQTDCRQTDRHTDRDMHSSTILCNRSRGRSNNKSKRSPVNKKYTITQNKH